MRCLEWYLPFLPPTVVSNFIQLETLVGDPSMPDVGVRDGRPLLRKDVRLRDVGGAVPGFSLMHGEPNSRLELHKRWLLLLVPFKPVPDIDHPVHRVISLVSSKSPRLMVVENPRSTV